MQRPPDRGPGRSQSRPEDEMRNGAPVDPAGTDARMVAAERVIAQLRLLLAALVRDAGGEVVISAGVLDDRDLGALDVVVDRDKVRLSLPRPDGSEPGTGPLQIGEILASAGRDGDDAAARRAALQRRVVQLLAEHAGNGGGDAAGPREEEPGAAR